MPPRANPTVRQKRLGAELRRLREAAGMSGEQAGAVLECGQAKISRIETGRNGIRPIDLKALLKAYQVKDQPLADALLEMAREGRRRGWWNQYRNVLDPRLADLADVESRAVALQTWETVVVPGLLQTPDYMRALFKSGRLDVPDKEIDKHVEVRSRRQAVLDDDNGPEYWAIIYESALVAQIGGARVMRGQLHYLADAAQKARVTVQVMPFTAGAHEGLNGSFLMVRTDTPGLDVVLLENLATVLYLEDPAHLRDYGLAFDQLRAAALGPVPSLDFIKRAAQQL